MIVRSGFKFNQDSLEKIKYILFLIVLFLEGKHNILDIIFTVLLCILLTAMKHRTFLFMYFALMFFEYNLSLPFIGINFYKIYQILFLIRTANRILNKKLIIYKKPTISYIAFVFLILLYSRNPISFIALLIDMLILLCIHYELNCEPCKKEEKTNLLLTIISEAAFLCAVYGLLIGDKMWDTFHVYQRTLGLAGDPNYSSILYIIGIIALLGITKIDLKKKSILFSVLLLALISTVSLTGILCFGVMIVLYSFIRKPQMGILLLFTLGCGFIIFMSLDYGESSLLFSIKYRIINLLQATSLEMATSFRSSLAVNYMSYFSSLPFYNKLIGGKDIVGSLRGDMVIKFRYISHNSYIDMLFMTGIIGTLIILFIQFVSIIKNIRIYYIDKNKQALSYSFLGILTLMYSLALSIFPMRYFYSFWLF